MVTGLRIVGLLARLAYFAPYAHAELDVVRAHEIALQRYGEKFLSFLCKPESLAAQRMVIAEAGRSDIGQRFHDAGPKSGQDRIAKYLSAKMDEGMLRRADTHIAADQLVALLQAEIMPRCLLGLPATATRGGGVPGCAYADPPR